MPANKSLLTWGLLGKVESAYGVDPTPTPSTDGILTLERPSFQIGYIFNGERGYSPATGSRAPAATPGGREASFTAVAEAIGGGAAYSSSVKPSVDVLLRAAGFNATLDATGGSESYTYTPESAPADMDSAAFYVYERGQLFKSLGSYAENLTISVDGPGIPSWEFPIKGICPALPTDVTLPAITYPSASNLPPKFEDVSLSVNSVTDLVLRGFTLELGRELSPRADGNSTSGHAGFQPGRRSPTLELVIESTPLSSFNPYSLREGATLIPVSFGWGGTQYKRVSISAPNCRVLEIGEDEDGTAAIWTVQFALSTSDYATADDLTITFD